MASFFPFHATYWLNGHSFIEQELKRAGVGFYKNDNAFLAVDDVAALQAAADRLSPAVILGPRTAGTRWVALRLPTHPERRPGRPPFPVLSQTALWPIGQQPLPPSARSITPAQQQTGSGLSQCRRRHSEDCGSATQVASRGSCSCAWCSEPRRCSRYLGLPCYRRTMARTTARVKRCSEECHSTTSRVRRGHRPSSEGCHVYANDSWTQATGGDEGWTTGSAAEPTLRGHDGEDAFRARFGRNRTGAGG